MILRVLCQSGFRRRLLEGLSVPLGFRCLLLLGLGASPSSCLICISSRVKSYLGWLACCWAVAPCFEEIPLRLADCALHLPACCAAFTASTQYDCCLKLALYRVEKSSSSRYLLPSGTSSVGVLSRESISLSRYLCCFSCRYPRCLSWRVKFLKIYWEWEIWMRWVTSIFIQSAPVILHGLSAQCTSCMCPMSVETFPWRNSVHPIVSWLAAAARICGEPPPPVTTREVNDQVPRKMRYFPIQYASSASVQL